MKNHKLMSTFALEADDQGGDEPADKVDPQALPAGQDWATRYPNTTRIIGPIFQRLYSELFSPRDEGGMPTTAAHFMVLCNESAAEPLNLMFSYCDDACDTPQEAEAHEHRIRSFLTNMASLNVEGVTVVLKPDHGAMSFDCPETVRQFFHTMCAASTFVFDESSGFRLRPEGVRPGEYDKTSYAKQKSNGALLSAFYIEEGQKLLDDKLDLATQLMPARPYPSLQDALAAAAYVGSRQQDRDVAISLDGVDCSVALDYKQPIPAPYAIFH